ATSSRSRRPPMLRTRSTAMRWTSPRRSGPPAEEIGDQREAEALTLLGMELSSSEIVARDHSRDGAAVVSHGDEISRIGRRQVIGVDEVGVQPVGAGRDTLEQGMLPPHV